MGGRYREEKEPAGLVWASVTPGSEAGGPHFQALGDSPPGLGLWVLTWRLMGRDENRKAEGGERIREWKEQEAPQGPGTQEDALLKVSTAYLGANAESPDARQALRSQESPALETERRLWGRFPRISLWEELRS